MRDPFSLTLPFIPIFGVRIRIHFLFFLVVFGLIFRQILLKEKVVWTGDLILSDNIVPATEIFGLVFGVLFLVVLAHEMAHAIAIRMMGGEPEERILWPLGGFQEEIPSSPQVMIWTAAAGLIAQVAICLVSATILLSNGYIPSFNPFANAYVCEIQNYRDGRVYTSTFGANIYEAGTNKRKEEYTPEMRKKFGKPSDFREEVEKARCDWAVAPTFLIWAQRTFFVSWIILLLNLLPAYPLDGGTILQAFIWARTDPRQGVTTTSYVSFVVCLLLIMFGISSGETLIMLLVGVIYISTAMRFGKQEHELDPFTSEFGQEYSSSLDQPAEEETPDPPPSNEGFWTRWRQAREEKNRQRETEQRQADEERMDMLLEKISRKEPLTDEEKQFMNYVSQRYRNRS